MYAIFRSGGKQYRASEGQIIRIEKLNISIGEIIKLAEIMMIANDHEFKIGLPFINNSVVEAEVIAHGRSKKTRIIKFRRRKNYRRQQGHRQWFTDIKITKILIST